MNDSKIREPELPGMKTYAKDRAARAESLSVAGVELPGMDEKDKEELHAPEAARVMGVGASARSDSILSDKDNVFDVTRAFENNVETGMILRDTRRRKRSFFKTLGAAFSEWAGGIKASAQDITFLKKKVKPTVTPGQERKDVVKRAGEMTRQVPHDDHTIVVEKLRTFEHDAEEATGKPYILKKPKPPEMKRGSWSHFVTNSENEVADEHIKVHREELTPDENTHAVAPHVVKHSNVPEHLKQHAELDADSVQHAPETPSVAERPLVKKITTTKNNVAPIAKPAQEHAAAEPEETTEENKVTNQKERQPTSRWSFFKNKIEPAKEEEPVLIPSFEERERAQAFEVPSFETTAAQKSRTYRADAIGEIEEQKLTAPQIAARERSRTRNTIRTTITEPSANRLLVMVVTILVVLGSVGAAGFFLFRGDDTPAESGLSAAPAFVRVQKTTSLPLSSDRDTLLSSLYREVMQSGSGLTHVFVALPGSEEPGAVLPATTADVFAVIEPRAPDTFVRALDSRHMFGGYVRSASSPFLILKTNSFDVAFSGMLAWEPYLAADLGLFFNTENLSGTYTDAAIRNTSVRILADGSGAERIVYGFTNRNTLIITTSRETFRVIEDAMR